MSMLRQLPWLSLHTSGAVEVARRCECCTNMRDFGVAQPDAVEVAVRLLLYSEANLFYVVAVKHLETI